MTSKRGKYGNYGKYGKYKSCVFLFLEKRTTTTTTIIQSATVVQNGEVATETGTCNHRNDIETPGDIMEVNFEVLNSGIAVLTGKAQPFVIWLITCDLCHLCFYALFLYIVQKL